MNARSSIPEDRSRTAVSLTKRTQELLRRCVLNEQAYTRTGDLIEDIFSKDSKERCRAQRAIKKSLREDS